MKSLCNALSRLIFGLILVLTVDTANAQTVGPGVPPATDSATVKYLGAQDDMLIFDVSYVNPQGNRFVVAVKDQDGNQLFQSSFRDKTFFKQFRLPKTEKDLITFVFRNGQDAPVEKRFAVNVSTRYVQEVAIKKL
jgi:hypothetical protein